MVAVAVAASLFAHVYHALCNLAAGIAAPFAGEKASRFVTGSLCRGAVEDFGSRELGETN
jgi:hypothetical protein